MASPGPAKGEGGRPRKPGGSKLKKGDHAGYVKKTVGPKSKGTQKYEHRHVTGAKPNEIVHHKDGSKGNNARSNLSRMSRAQHNKEHPEKGRG